MDNRKGKCINFGNDCPIADHKQVVELTVTEDFVCPECGSNLIEEVKPKPFPVIPIIIAAVLLVGIGFGVFWFFIKAKPLAITPKNPTVNVGKTEKMKVQTKDKKINWIWTSSHENVATVSNKGVVLAIDAGSATITATSEDDSSISVSTLVTVKGSKKVEQSQTSQTPQRVRVLTVSLDKSRLTMKVSQKETIFATVLPDSVANREVKWYSSDETVAKVDNNGNVSAIKEGKAIITAISEEDKTKSADCEVTVEPQAAEPPCGGQKSYTFGTYNGGLVRHDGICMPDGRGRMNYTCRVRIAKHSGRNIYTEPGDYYIGSWSNGDILEGNLFNSNGNQRGETIRAGKRSSPYDIANDRCE